MHESFWDVKVVVAVGDITEENTDAIVNAANFREKTTNCLPIVIRTV